LLPVRHRERSRIGQDTLSFAVVKEKNGEVEGELAGELCGLGREGPGVGAGDGEAEDGEGGVAEGGGHVGHGASDLFFLSFFLVRCRCRARKRRSGGDKFYSCPGARLVTWW
jgi:hypothetical protein